MRGFLLILIVVMLTFAVGGGGGDGGTPKLDYDLSATFSCPENELRISVDVSGNPISGMVIGVQKSGRSIGNKETNADGIAVFTISESGSYYVLASRSGYKTKDTTVAVDICESEETVEQLEMCNQATRAERVQCVMGLSDENRAAVLYTPEECREQGDASRQQCINTYRLFQTCRNLETDEEREACIKPKLNISDEVHVALQQCQEKIGAQRALCVQQLRERVLSLVKFRMYNLEYKAEEFLEAGISEDKAVEITIRIEEAKIAFNRAITLRDKINVVKQLKEDWLAFVQDAKEELGVE